MTGRYGYDDPRYRTHFETAVKVLDLDNAQCVAQAKLNLAYVFDLFGAIYYLND